MQDRHDKHARHQHVDGSFNSLHWRPSSAAMAHARSLPCTRACQLASTAGDTVHLACVCTCTRERRLKSSALHLDPDNAHDKERPRGISSTRSAATQPATPSPARSDRANHPHAHPPRASGRPHQGVLQYISIPSCHRRSPDQTTDIAVNAMPSIPHD